MWDSIPVLEELSVIDKAFMSGVDPNLIKHDKELWGLNQFADKVERLRAKEPPEA